MSEVLKELITSKTALLVIDMQNAFCKPEGTMEKLGFDIRFLQEPIPYIQRLSAQARNEEIPVIFTRYVYCRDYSDGGILISEVLPQIREVGGLREGTWDVEIIDELKPTPADIVIDKNRYSAFYGTSLDSILKEKEIETLLVTGVTTNMCVESTVRDAHSRDYRVRVVREATAEVDPERYKVALNTIDLGFGQIINVDEAVSVLEASTLKDYPPVVQE